MGGTSETSISPKSGALSRSGSAGGASGTGRKVFNFGANPNTGLAGNILSNPILLIAGGVIVWIVIKKRR